MSNGVNKVILVGHLGADPEVRMTNSGKEVANLRLATSESFKKQDGSFEEKTEWHRLVAWGKKAQVVKEYLKKGRQIYVEGKLHSHKWEDREGKPRWSTEVLADRIMFLGGPREDAARGYQGVADADGDFPDGLN